NKFINEQLGTPSEQQPTREQFGGIITPGLSEEQVANLENIPIIGPAVAREAQFFSTPARLAASLVWPVFLLRGAVGGVALASAAGLAGAPEPVQVGAQLVGNVLTPGAGIVPKLSTIGKTSPKATVYVTRLTEEIVSLKQQATLWRGTGKPTLIAQAQDAEHAALILEGSLARAQGRALVSEPTGAVIGEGALTPTKAEIGILRTVRAETIGDIIAPEFAQAPVRADVRATGETISSQVLQPRPQTGPAILQTQLPQGVTDVGQRLAAEPGGGTLTGLGEVKDAFGRLIDPLLPQGGIEGGFVPRPSGMRPGAKVTGLTQEGEQIEGTLIQVSGDKAIVR
ncbi:hypothetical protein LCGC14_3128800, partial [marine sediment metagenome]